MIDRVYKSKSYILKDFYGEDYTLVAFSSHYSSNNSLAVFLCDIKSGELFDDITVNLPMSFTCESDCAFLDVNNCPWAISFLEYNHLAVPTGRVSTSGFCVYPEFKFNLSMLAIYKEEK